MKTKPLNALPLIIALLMASAVITFDLIQPRSVLRSLIAQWTIDNPTRIEPQPVTINEIKNIGELSTTRQTISIPVPAEQDAQILGITYGTTKLLLLAQVHVVAGIDINKIKEANIQQKNGTVLIKLPAPQVLTATLGKTSIYDYNRGTLGLGPDVGPQLQMKAQSAAIQQALQAACQNKLLDQANESAEALLDTFLNRTHPQQPVQIQTTPGQTCQLPSNS